MGFETNTPEIKQDKTEILRELQNETGALLKQIEIDTVADALNNLLDDILSGGNITSTEDLRDRVRDCIMKAADVAINEKNREKWNQAVTYKAPTAYHPKLGDRIRGNVSLLGQEIVTDVAIDTVGSESSVFFEWDMDVIKAALEKLKQ